MKKLLSICLLLLITSALSGCYQNQQQTMHTSWDQNKDWINDCETEGTCDDSIDYTKPKQEKTSYDQESWKTIIPETCKSFFDGCNNCSKTENDWNIACTMMYCENYQEPKCNDK
jgi:hypothetical protein